MKDKKYRRKGGKKESSEGTQLALTKVVSRKSLKANLPPKSAWYTILLERNEQVPFLTTVGSAEFSGSVPGAYLNC